MPLELIQRALGAEPALPRDAVAEANHRIANNLTLVAGLVRMHARSAAAGQQTLAREHVSLLLEEVGARIDTVGRLHRLLANSGFGAAIALPEYLREISEAVVQSLTFAGKARLSETSINTPECAVAPERALPLGLIVGEVVTNAVKYAHPAGIEGNIAVGCKRTNGRIIIEIADDGIGLPEGFDPSRDGGLGLRLVRSLAAQLGASLAFTDTGTGLTVQIQMPA